MSGVAGAAALVAVVVFGWLYNQAGLAGQTSWVFLAVAVIAAVPAAVALLGWGAVRASRLRIVGCQWSAPASSPDKSDASLQRRGAVIP